ncbi:MAG TPA: hypothetical protein VF884_03800, partial [Nitrososphaeraceae archaeon]
VGLVIFLILTKPKQKSSPRSTGGIGDSFENQVGAIYLTSLLLESIPPGRLHHCAKRIYFQGKEDWIPTGFDDLARYLIIISKAKSLFRSRSAFHLLKNLGKLLQIVGCLSKIQRSIWKKAT